MTNSTEQWGEAGETAQQLQHTLPFQKTQHSRQMSLSLMTLLSPSATWDPANTWYSLTDRQTDRQTYILLKINLKRNPNTVPNPEVSSETRDNYLNSKLMISNAGYRLPTHNGISISIPKGRK